MLDIKTNQFKSAQMKFSTSQYFTVSNQSTQTEDLLNDDITGAIEKLSSLLAQKSATQIENAKLKAQLAQLEEDMAILEQTSAKEKEILVLNAKQSTEIIYSRELCIAQKELEFIEAQKSVIEEVQMLNRTLKEQQEEYERQLLDNQQIIEGYKQRMGVICKQCKNLMRVKNSFKRKYIHCKDQLEKFVQLLQRVTIVSKNNHCNACNLVQKERSKIELINEKTILRELFFKECRREDSLESVFFKFPS